MPARYKFNCPHCGKLIAIIRHDKESATKAAAAAREKKLKAWESVDWSKTNTEIAAVTKTSIATVYAKRLIFAPKSVITRQQRQAEWASVDWEKTNWKIARELGVSLQQVYQKRKLLAPKSRPDPAEFSTRSKLFKWSKVDWSKSDVQIAKKLGCSHQAVNQRRQSLCGRKN